MYQETWMCSFADERIDHCCYIEADVLNRIKGRTLLIRRIIGCFKFNTAVF